MKTTLRKVLYSLLVLLFILHNDFWFWDTSQITLGLPIGLLYHIVFCLAASLLMASLVKFEM
jgi:hypothetical protein